MIAVDYCTMRQCRMNLEQGRGQARPLIGITCAHDQSQRLFVRQEYVDAVLQAGGIPLLLPALDPSALDEDVDQQLASVDGVIFSGGNDYDATQFGEARHPSSVLMSQRREAYDVRMFARVRQRALPCLCICAGAQLAAVHFGARIIQDIASTFVHPRQHRRPFKQPAHVLSLEAGTQLRALFRCRYPLVNSVHHQSINPRHLPQGMRISAYADDGIVEAFELEPGSTLDNGAWFCAVQWHPEHLCDDEDQLNLFRTLIQHAAAAEVARLL